MLEMLGSILRVANPVLGSAITGVGGLFQQQGNQQMAARDLALLRAQQAAGMQYDPYFALRQAALMAAMAAPIDPLAEMCPVLSEPDPIIVPDPWYRRWWIALLRWIVRHLP